MLKLFVIATLAVFAPAVQAAESGSTPVSTPSAGDMGNADIRIRNDLPLKLQYVARCAGPYDNFKKMPDCDVSISPELIQVDGSKGISRGQIIGINMHLESLRKYINLLYRTSKGKVSVAEFGISHNNNAKQFYNAVLLFMGGEIPEVDSSTSKSSVN